MQLIARQLYLNEAIKNKNKSNIYFLITKDRHFHYEEFRKE